MYFYVCMHASATRVGPPTRFNSFQSGKSIKQRRLQQRNTPELRLLSVLQVVLIREGSTGNNKRHGGIWVYVIYVRVV